MWAAQAQREQSLGYDAFGRLRQVSQAGQQAGQGQSFEYDGNGNRIGQRSDTLGQLRFALAPRSDRLLAVQGDQGQARQSYRYNEAGEPVRIEQENGQVRTLHYDALGQIGTIEQDGKLLARYAYNGARQRVAKTVHQEDRTSTTYYTWHKGLLDAELDEQGRVQHLRGLQGLEDQLCRMSLQGFQGRGSPDRLDALVWALHELMIRPCTGQGRPGIRGL